MLSKVKEMKKISLFIIALVVSAYSQAQNIDYAEYFFENDPGYGNGFSIPISTPASELTLQFAADIHDLTQGMHYIFFRAKDDAGQWGPVGWRVFFHVKLPSTEDLSILQVEYFIDNDPGFGNAVSIAVETPGNNLTLEFTRDIQDLDQGMHYIYFRAKDNAGRWGQVARGVFFHMKLPSSSEPSIQQVEYFFDNDPGYGMGTQVSLSSTESEQTIDFNASLGGLADGNHVLYVRARNEQFRWGQIFAQGFTYNSTGTDQGEVKFLYKIYPNPASEQLIIEITDQTLQSVPIRISDMSGAVVYETLCDEHPCKITPELSAGIYLISIKIDERYITQRIILE